MSITWDQYVQSNGGMDLANTASSGNAPVYSDQFNAQPQQSQGWLADLLGGIINPFVNLGKIGLEGALKGATMLSGVDPSKYKPVFMKPSEYYGVQERPVQTAAGAATTLGSLLIPGGGTIPGMIGKGALSGAMFGGGQELMRPESTVGSVLSSAGTGGLFGGATGLALGGVGKVIKGLRTPEAVKVPKSPEELVPFIQGGKTKGIFGETPETMVAAPKTGIKSSFSETAMEEIRKPYLKQAMGERVTELKMRAEQAGVINPGVKISTNMKADEVLSNILEKNLVQKIKGTKFEGITNRGVLKTIETVAKTEDIASIKTSAFRTLKKQLSNDRPLSGETVETLRKWVKGQFKGVAGKTITDAEMTGRQVILDSAHDVIGALLDQKVPGAGRTLSDLHALATEANGLYNFSSNKGRAFIKGIPIPVKQAEMTAKATADRLANQGLLGVTPGVVGRIRNAPVPQLPAGLRQKGLSLTPLSILGAEAGQGGQGSLPLGTTGTEATTGTAGATGVTGTTSANAMQGQQQILNMLAAGMKPSDVKIIADLLGFSPSTTAPKGLSNNQINAKQGLIDLGVIRETLKKAGNISLITPYFLKTSEGKQLSNAIDSVSDIIARNRTGAAINESELKLYLSFLPTLTDDPATIESKLSRLENIFGGVLQSVGTSTSTDQLTNQISTILGQ